LSSGVSKFSKQIAHVSSSFSFFFVFFITVGLPAPVDFEEEEVILGMLPFFVIA
jgi:hypothetical protein